MTPRAPAATASTAVGSATGTVAGPLVPPMPGLPATQPAPQMLTTDTVSKRTCEVCGNDYDKAIAVVQDGRSHVFDCFECAIHALAPACAHCGCRIVGHGMESGREMFCCAHCAQARGVADLKDRT